MGFQNPGLIIFDKCQIWGYNCISLIVQSQLKETFEGRRKMPKNVEIVILNIVAVVAEYYRNFKRNEDAKQLADKSYKKETFNMREAVRNCLRNLGYDPQAQDVYDGIYKPIMKQLNERSAEHARNRRDHNPDKIQPVPEITAPPPQPTPEPLKRRRETQLLLPMLTVVSCPSPSSKAQSAHGWHR